jgi:Lar family restriction alleviation protein
MDSKNSNEELLPCPFCGSTNLKFLEGQIIGNRPVGPNRMIRCEDCHVTGPYTLKEFAILHWNKRKEKE